MSKTTNTDQNPPTEAPELDQASEPRRTQAEIDEQEKLDEEAERAEAGPQLTRDQMRDMIFGAEPESEIIDFFNVRLELRQPPMSTMLEARQGAPQNALLMMLVNYAYVPGTDEHVFDDGDIEMLKGLPLSPSTQRALEACNKLMGISAPQLDALIQEGSKST
jgi:hypothetical protein